MTNNHTSAAHAADGHESHLVTALRNPATVRLRAAAMLDAGIAGTLRHFDVHMEKLADVADYVADVIRANYPDLRIPYHARFRHFEAAGKKRWDSIAARIPDRIERARAAIDCVVVSVLLDAGAGAKWSYTEPDGTRTNRSEGLGVASLAMFESGLFSSDALHPLQADADGLANLDKDALAHGFQITGENPMVGFDGRFALLKTLANALRLDPVFMGSNGKVRPGFMFDHLTQHGKRHDIQAVDIFDVVLKGLSPIWPGRVQINGENMGDVWAYADLKRYGFEDGLMPFHKLSQWLTYSLIEAFEMAGIRVTELDALTGLAEYRNGGLMLESGLITLKNAKDLDAPHAPSDPIIIEWRALTVALLGRLREPVAEVLGVDEKDFPLARLLEGGTWWAGRKYAFSRDPSGDPPLKIVSDGTVF